MPRIPEYEQRCADVTALSVGGSTLFPPEHPELDTDFFQEFKSFLSDQLRMEKSVIAVIGGGEIARRRQQAARDMGIRDQYDLDMIGIFTTRHNADYLRRMLICLDIDAKRYSFQPIKPGVVYLRGGDKPGSTTDLIAVKAAIRAGTDVINVSNTPGLYPFLPDGSFERSKILEEITYDELLPHLPEHKPGINIPFSREAALLARNHGKRIILVGKDMENLRHCLCGNDFTGTVVQEG